MSARTDILDQPEPLKRSLAGSLILHVSVAAFFVTANLVGGPHVEQWGELNGGGMGSVAVNPVAKIPLPERSGPVNPVANDTQSHVPEPQAKPKALPKVPAKPLDLDPEAIALKSRNVQKRLAAQANTEPNKWRDQQQYRPNQLTSTAGQQVNSPLYGMAGGGGVGVGTNSPFGTQLGYYATLLRDAVARKWNTGDIDARITTAPPVFVMFTLRRDGSVAPGSVRITQRSGNAGLDSSAQRAVLDAAPFPPIPPQYTKNEAEIEFQFVLKR